MTIPIHHPSGGVWLSSGQPLHDGMIEDCAQADCVRRLRDTRTELAHKTLHTITGVGPDAPVETNANGASQSRTEYAITSIDPRTLLSLARVHAQGDHKYGRDNWRGISTEDHLNHAMVHILAWLAGDRSDDHLTHAMCRLGMAHATNQKEDEN